MKLTATLVSALRVQSAFFTHSREENARENLAVMQIAGSLGTVAATVFFLIAPVIIPSWSITIEYILVVPILALSFCFSFFYSHRKAPLNPLTVEIASAVFYVLVLGDMIALSAFPYPNTPQIFVSLCFMFMPVLMILRPWVLLGLMGAGEAVFLFLAAQYKTDFAIENDIFNTIAALFFSLIIMGTINRLRCRNYSARAQLEKLSQTDALTGILNKKAFEESCAAFLITREARSGCALLVLDLDDFKHVNDNFGHPFGDALLTQIGRVLRQTFRQTDLVGRIGGDEFAVLMGGVCDEAVVRRKCEAVKQLCQALVVEGQALPTTLSIGVALNVGAPTTYPNLFHIADEALYLVKRDGKDATAIQREA